MTENPEYGGEPIVFAVKRNTKYAILRGLLFSLIVPVAMIGGAGIGVACGAEYKTLYLMVLLALAVEVCTVYGIARSVAYTRYVLTPTRAVCDKGRKGHVDVKLTQVTEVTCKRSRIFKNCGHIYFNAKYNICNFYCVNDLDELYQTAVTVWKDLKENSSGLK